MALPIRQSSSLSAARTLHELVQTAAGMLGLFLAERTPLRTAVTLTVLGSSAAFLAGDGNLDMHVALGAFAAVCLLRHALLFTSFGPGGHAAQLKSRLGSERGFELFEAVAALSLHAQRLAFLAILLASPQLAFSPPTGRASDVIIATGTALLVVGVAMSIWGTSRVGLDSHYYYRDLFRGPRHVSLECEGMYVLSGNPAYGWAPLAAYGAALIALSPEGIVAAAVNQVLLYLFNQRVEKPHLRAARRIAADHELRDSLARTLIERPAAQRRSVPPPRRSSPPPEAKRRSVPPPPPRVRAVARWAEVIDVEVAPDSKAA